MARHYLDGRPYYCKACGVGYGEWMACEEVGCELESTEDAQARKRVQMHGGWSVESHLGALTDRPVPTSGKLVPSKSRRIRKSI